MCPYSSPIAIALWGKACNFHRGSDPSHSCANPFACHRVLDSAFSEELCSKGWE